MLYDKATHFGNYEMCLISDLSTITEEGMVIELDPTKDSVNGVPYGRVATGETQVLGVSVHEVRRPSILRGVVDFTSSPANTAGDNTLNAAVPVPLGHAAVEDSVVVFKLDADGNPTTFTTKDNDPGKLIPKVAVDRASVAGTAFWADSGSTVEAGIEAYSDTAASGYAQYKVAIFEDNVWVAIAAAAQGVDPADDGSKWFNAGPVANIPVYQDGVAYPQNTVVSHGGKYYVAKSDISANNNVNPDQSSDAAAAPSDDALNWKFASATNTITLSAQHADNDIENSTKYRAMFDYMPTVQELDYLVGDRKPRHTPEQWNTDVGIGIGLLTAGMIGTSMFEPGYWKVGDRVKSGPGGILVPATIKDYNDAGSTPNVMENWYVSHTPGPTVDNENYLGIRKHPAR